MKRRLATIALAAIASLILLLIIWLAWLPISYIWVVDRGEALDQTYLVKLCPNGAQVFRVQFGQSGAVGVDPRDGSAWAPELNDAAGVNFDQVVHVGADGRILQRVGGMRALVLAVDPRDGSPWVALPNEARIVKLDPAGAPRLSVPGSDGPASMAVDPRDGSLWVAHYRGGVLTHLSSQGEALLTITTPGFFSDAPHQVAVDPRNGDVWHTGAGDGSLSKRSASGELLARAAGFDRPVSVALDPYDGSAWVTDFSLDEQGALVKIGANGERVVTLVLDSPPRLVGLNPADRSLWVGIDGALVKLSATGRIQKTLRGYTRPVSIAFHPNPPGFQARLDFLRSCGVSR